MAYRHTPGHAVWKFVFAHGVYYRNSNASAMKYFYDSREQDFAIYVRTIDGWKWVSEHHYSDKCRCGRSYTDSFNGLEFRWRDALLSSYKTVEECITIFDLPELCQICHYSNEYKVGRWCPKWVRQQIGVE
jgi:hypothetical protein